MKRYSFERAPLHLAAEHGHVDVVKVLIKAKVDVNELSHRTNGCCSALYCASRSGHVEAMKVLLKAKPNRYTKS